MTITPRDMPGGRDMRTTDERLYVAHHIRVEKDQAPAVVHPAKAIMFGMTKLGAGDTLHPQITLYALCQDFGLTFIPNADELAALGQAMLDHAEKMRADASAQAADLIERARGK